MAKTYKGVIVQGDMRAYFCTENRTLQPLNHRLDLENKSPSGISWGYQGSGPSQLSLALLADVVGDSRALRIYHYFKDAHIAPLSMKEGWEMTEDDIRRKAEAIEASLGGNADG